MWKVSPSPESGHFTSTIFTTPAGTLSSGRSDYEFAREFTRRHDLAQRVNAILFSPAFSKNASGARDASNCLLDPQELAEWMLEDNVLARLGLQIHKLIWDPALKGV